MGNKYVFHYFDKQATLCILCCLGSHRYWLYAVSIIPKLSHDQQEPEGYIVDYRQ